MKMSNFRLTGENKKYYYAEADFTDGTWFKRTEKDVKLFRPVYSYFWRRLDSGEAVYGVEADNAEMAYRAKMACNS